eukprot:1236813-Pleurochrysis_carterae.AAC.2
MARAMKGIRVDLRVRSASSSTHHSKAPMRVGSGWTKGAYVDQTFRLPILKIVSSIRMESSLSGGDTRA